MPVAVVAPDEARPGEPLTIQAVLTNNKVGHDFPTGPLDIIQAWVELTSPTRPGTLVFQTGQRDAANFIAPGTFMLKAEPVDQYGHLIDRHNLWEMVGVRYRRSLFPGFSDKETFTFLCPATAAAAPTGVMIRNPGDTSPLNRHAPHCACRASAVTELHVTARLMYRKADQFLINFLFGKESGLTAPVTVMSEDQKTIRVTSRSGALARPTRRRNASPSAITAAVLRGVAFRGRRRRVRGAGRPRRMLGAGTYRPAEPSKALTADLARQAPDGLPARHVHRRHRGSRHHASNISAARGPRSCPRTWARERRGATSTTTAGWISSSPTRWGP